MRDSEKTLGNTNLVASKGKAHLQVRCVAQNASSRKHPSCYRAPEFPLRLSLHERLPARQAREAYRLQNHLTCESGERLYDQPFDCLQKASF